MKTSQIKLMSALILSLCTAGSSLADPNIVGGSLVNANEAVSRSIVGLILEATNGGQGVCSGSILNRNTILTAAHCVQNLKSVTILFTRDITTKGLLTTPAAMMRKGDSYKASSAFVGNGSEELDVALIKFSGGIPTGFVPALVLDPAISIATLKPGTKVVLAGFGTTGRGRSDSGILRKATMVVKSHSPNHKQVELVNDGESSCSGDSGGPAYYVANGKYYLFGVLSRGNCTSFSVYTRLSSNLGAQFARP